MRKFCLVVIGMFLLAGCRTQKDLETVMDSVSPVQPAAKMEMTCQLPQDAAVETMASGEDSQIWFCENYVLMQEIRESGDIHKTLEKTTGYTYDSLSVMQTQQNNIKRYDCVWTSAGEGGEQIGRCAVLDDGNYHYVLSVMADSVSAGALTESVWNPLFSSFQLLDVQL